MEFVSQSISKMSRRKSNPWWKIELGIEFQKEVIVKIRSIVKSYEINTPINDNDTEFLLKVLRHHHRFDQKIGVGMKHLEVRINPSWNGPTNGLWIVRTDGTENDISWTTALQPDGKPTPKEEASSAARDEISSQIHDFHDTGDCSICEICHKNMTRGDGLHVDHIKPFQDLFLEFLKSLEMTYHDITTEDLGVESQFLDRELALKWYDFHLKHSTLRLVHNKCNLGRKK